MREWGGYEKQIGEGERVADLNSELDERLRVMEMDMGWRRLVGSLK